MSLLIPQNTSRPSTKKQKKMKTDIARGSLFIAGWANVTTTENVG